MDMATGKLEQVFLKITHFYNSFIMHYTEYYILRDCSGFLQIRSYLQCTVITQRLVFNWKNLILVIYVIDPYFLLKFVIFVEIYIIDASIPIQFT